MMYYSLLVILFMMIINAFIMPSVERAKIEEVDYGTFMTMTENKQIEKVELARHTAQAICRMTVW